jgi:hypothetical protein
MRGKRSTNQSIGKAAGTVRTQSGLFRALERIRSLATGNRDYVEELAVGSDTALGRLSQRRIWLMVAFLAGFIAIGIVWILALRFPYTVSSIYSIGVNSDLPRFGTLLTILLMSIPFAPPFVAVFALSHLMFPSPAPTEIASGLMSTFEYRHKANRRTLIVIVAGMAGALNCIALLIAVTEVTGR